MIIIQIKHLNTLLKIYNIYCTNRKIDYKFEKLFSKDGGYIIISGDMNAHHSFWTSKKADSMSNIIFKEYSNFDFIIVNDNIYITTPSSYHRQSTIDLTLVTLNLYLIISV